MGQKSYQKFCTEDGVAEVSPIIAPPFLYYLPCFINITLSKSIPLLLDEKYLGNILFKTRDLIYYLSRDICIFEMSLQKEGKM